MADRVLEQVLRIGGGKIIVGGDRITSKEGAIIGEGPTGRQ